MKIRSFIKLISILFPISLFAQNVPDTTYYSVVINGFIIGEQLCWKNNDSTYNYIYNYSERGRGDSLRAELIADENYLVKRVSCYGTDYYHQPYQQKVYSRNDSIFSEENGFNEYVSKNNSQYYLQIIPAARELLYKSVLKMEDKKIPVGYGDSLYLNSITLHSINHNGRSIPIKLIELYVGFGLPPEFIWVDEKDNYFADVSFYGWRQHIKKGFEGWVDTLVKWQEQQSLNYFSREFTKLSKPIDPYIAISDVRIFNSKTATISEHKTVLIQNGSIIEIGDFDKLKIPEQYVIISGVGKTMLPGFWDMHAHYTSDDGPLYLSGGITHVRDMGNTPSILLWQKSIREHKMLGPDITFTSGFIDKISPLQGPIGKIVPTLEKAIQAELDSKMEGYSHIKLYGSIEPVWVKTLCDTAHALGFRIGGHIPFGMNVFDVADAGYDDISHMVSLMGSLLSDSLSRAKSKAAGYRALGKNLDLNGPEIKTLLKTLKEKEITIDPTLSFYYEMYSEYAGDTITAYKAVFAWIPEVYHNNLIVSTPKVNAEFEEEYKLFYNRMLEVLKLAFENDIRIVAGTDGSEQLGFQRELELYVQAGIPELEVLKIATYNGALNCGLESQFGSIEQGRVADLILIEGSPEINISDIRKVFLVITNNRIFSPKELYKNGGWTYYY